MSAVEDLLGDGWRRVTHSDWRGEEVPPWEDQAYVRIGSEDFYFFRKPPMPDLPTEPDTVIAVTWDDAVSANHDRLLRGMGGWLDTDGAIWTEKDLLANITAWELKATPSRNAHEERHTNADVAVLLEDAKKLATWETRREVLAAVRQMHLGCDDARVNLEAGLQQYEVAYGLRDGDDPREHPHTS